MLIKPVAGLKNVGLRVFFQIVECRLTAFFLRKVRFTPQTTFHCSLDMLPIIVLQDIPSALAEPIIGFCNTFCVYNAAFQTILG